jgi:hypothetical protein
MCKMNHLISSFMTDNPGCKITYRLQLQHGKDAFDYFFNFYAALMTVPDSLISHYSVVHFIDINDVKGIYKLQQNATYKKETDTVLCEIQSKNSTHTVEIVSLHSTRQEPFDILNFTLQRVELIETWEFNIDNTTYFLEKKGSGKTKCEASTSEPCFSIRIKHHNVNTVYDLFGRTDDDDELSTGSLYVKVNKLFCDV